MNASPNSPPTMWTPPSGMLRPPKYCRISKAFADHGRFCNLIMTLISYASYPRTTEKKLRNFLISLYFSKDR